MHRSSSSQDSSKDDLLAITMNHHHRTASVAPVPRSLSGNSGYKDLKFNECATRNKRVFASHDVLRDNEDDDVDENEDRNNTIDERRYSLSAMLLSRLFPSSLSQYRRSHHIAPVPLLPPAATNSGHEEEEEVKEDTEQSEEEKMQQMLEERYEGLDEPEGEPPQLYFLKQVLDDVVLVLHQTDNE